MYKQFKHPLGKCFEGVKKTLIEYYTVNYTKQFLQNLTYSMLTTISYFNSKQTKSSRFIIDYGIAKTDARTII